MIGKKAVYMTIIKILLMAIISWYTPVIVAALANNDDKTNYEPVKKMDSNFMTEKQ